MSDPAARYLHNGRPVADAGLLLDRGLQYGDGVFRTLAVHAGEVLDIEGQLALLAEDAHRIEIDVETDQLASECRELGATAGNAALKIIITRGSSQRGYAIPDDCLPNRFLYLAPPPAHIGRYAEQGVTLLRNPVSLGHNPQLAGIKHLNRLEQVLARKQCGTAAGIEGLMLDIGGQVIGGIQANLFFSQAGSLYTPDLSRCGVAGRTRQRIMALAAAAGIDLQSGDYPLQSLLQADEIFICNSLIGIWPATSVDAQAFTIGPLTRRLQTLLQHPGLS